MREITKCKSTPRDNMMGNSRYLPDTWDQVLVSHHVRLSGIGVCRFYVHTGRVNELMRTCAVRCLFINMCILSIFLFSLTAFQTASAGTTIDFIASGSERGTIRHDEDKWAIIPKLGNNSMISGGPIDGWPDETSWTQAPPLHGFKTAYYENPVEGIEYKLLYGDDYLYVRGTVVKEEADSIQKIELAVKRSPSATYYYVVSVPVIESHESSKAQLDTIWNPSLNDRHDDDGRINISSVISNVYESGPSYIIEMAIPLRAISAAGVQSGDEWQINVMHVHHLYTKPLTSWIPIHQSWQWDTGQSYNGGAVGYSGYVIGQGRLGSVFFDHLPDNVSKLTRIASTGTPQHVKDIKLSYVDFTRKQLEITWIDEHVRVENIQVHWQSPGEPWRLLGGPDVSTKSPLTVVEFTHPGTVSNGIYKLMLTYTESGADKTFASLLTFDRQYVIEAGINLNPPISSPEITNTAIEWKEASDQVKSLIDLIPPQVGFRFVGLPEMPELYPDGLYRLGADKRSLIAIPTGTVYPSDDPALKENKHLLFENRKGEPSVYPYHEDEQGRRTYITGHLWYLQKQEVINEVEQLAQLDPLGAARVLYALSQASEAWHPVVDRDTTNRVLPADSGPPYAYWGGMWARTWWNDLVTVGKMANAYSRIKHTNALELLSQEVGEDVEEKLINETFLPAIDFIFSYPISRGNLANRVWLGLIRIGRSLDDPDIIHRAVEHIRDYVTRGKFLYDGFWHEVTMSYHIQTINELVGSINLLQGWSDPEGYISPRTGTRFDNLDISKEVPIIEKASEISRFMVYPDRRYLPIMDTWANEGPRNADLNKGSFLLPAAKVGRLTIGQRAEQTQLNVNFQPKYEHIHRDGINITLFADGLELLPDIGYLFASKYRWFTQSTIGHNTVVVDSQDMSNNVRARHGGNIEAFVTSPLFQVIRSSYAEGYSSVREYSRELWLVPFSSGDDREAYILDIFRVDGGKRHEYTLQGVANIDAEFRTDRPTIPYGPYLLPKGTKVVDPTGPRTPGSAEGQYPGYIYVRDVEQVDLQGDKFTLTLLTEELGNETPRLKLTGLLSDDKNELYLGRSPSLRLVRVHGRSYDNNQFVDQHTMPKMVLRRDGTNLRSDFVTLMEPLYDNKGSQIGVIEQMPLAEGPKGAMAIRIIHGDTIDILLSNPHYVEGPVIAEDLELHGEFGFIRMRDGIVREMKMIGGTLLRKGSDVLEGRGRESGTVTATLRLNDGDEVDGVIVDTKVSCRLVGKYVVIHHPDGSTSGFEIGSIQRRGDQTMIVFAEHEPGFVINADGSSHQAFYPGLQWNGMHTFAIAHVDQLSQTADVGESRRGSGTITGTVFDLNGHPIEAASVNVAGYSSIVSMSDEHGRFELEGVPDGKQWFKATHDLYGSALSEAVTMNTGESPKITLTLGERLPPRLFDLTSGVSAGESISVTSNVDATLYLVRSNAFRGVPSESALMTSATATVKARANNPVLIKTEIDFQSSYMLYAVDEDGRVSQGAAVNIRNTEEERRVLDLFEAWQW